MDDTFSTSGQRFFEICRGIKEMGLRWNCCARVNLVDEEKIRCLAESGCEGIQMGVEAGSQRMLDLMRKGTTIGQIRDAFMWSRRYGLSTDATFIIGGHPSETIEDIRAIRRLVREIRPSTFSCSVLIPYPGTEIYHTMKVRGYIPEENWDEYVLIGAGPRYRTDNFTYAQLRKFQNSMLAAFYLRPGFFLKRLFSVRSPGELAYWIKAAVSFGIMAGRKRKPRKRR
jgi:anaerobic magnesium-protoporphyrin IX monomethyl ester cyclase